MSDAVIAALDLVAISATGDRRSVQVRVAPPRETDHGDWACALSLEGLQPKLSPIIGEDSLQALCLALRLAASLLHDVVALGGQLEYEAGDAFPLEAYFAGVAHIDPLSDRDDG